MSKNKKITTTKSVSISSSNKQPLVHPPVAVNCECGQELLLIKFYENRGGFVETFYRHEMLDTQNIPLPIRCCPNCGKNLTTGDKSLDEISAEFLEAAKTYEFENGGVLLDATQLQESFAGKKLFELTNGSKIIFDNGMKDWVKEHTWPSGIKHLTPVSYEDRVLIEMTFELYAEELRRRESPYTNYLKARQYEMAKDRDRLYGGHILPTPPIKTPDGLLRALRYGSEAGETTENQEMISGYGGLVKVGSEKTADATTLLDFEKLSPELKDEFIKKRQELERLTNQSFDWDNLPPELAEQKQEQDYIAAAAMLSSLNPGVTVKPVNLGNVNGSLANPTISEEQLKQMEKHALRAAQNGAIAKVVGVWSPRTKTVDGKNFSRADFEEEFARGLEQNAARIAQEYGINRLEVAEPEFIEELQKLQMVEGLEEDENWIRHYAPRDKPSREEILFARRMAANGSVEHQKFLQAVDTALNADEQTLQTLERTAKTHSLTFSEFVEKFEQEKREVKKKRRNTS